MTDEEIRDAACRAYDAEKKAGGSWLDGFGAIFRAGMVAGGAEALAAMPTKRGKPKEVLSIADVVAAGADESYARSWFASRGRNRLTEAAWDRMRKEADRAGMSIADAVKVCAESGWVGFRASYVANSVPAQSSRHESPRERAARERVERVSPGAAAQPAAWPGGVIDGGVTRID